MHREEQDMLLVPHPDQLHSEQGAALEMERPAGFLARQLVGFPIASVIRQRAQIVGRNLHLRGWRDSLEYLATQGQESSAKRLVPRNNVGDGAAERRSVQISTVSRNPEEML